MNREEKLQALLKLKRHETPGEAYFEAFSAEFHRYQRNGVLEARKSWWYRWQRGFNEFLEDMSLTPKIMAQASATAFGVVLFSLMIWVGSPQEGSHQSGMSLASVEQNFVDGSQASSHSLSDQAELTMAHLTSFDHDFEGSTYVTGESALSYDSVATF